MNQLQLYVRLLTLSKVKSTECNCLLEIANAYLIEPIECNAEIANANVVQLLQSIDCHSLIDNAFSNQSINQNIKRMFDIANASI
jgi:hypothetical protein